jgi:O-methyltransferase
MGPMPPHEVEFAAPRFPDLADSYFYHRMTLPDVGEVGGEWDLRSNTPAYLGQTDFSGKSVLEIGPASGFITAHMERAGAKVVSVDLPVDYGWDVVPRPGMSEDWLNSRRQHLQRLHNGFWFTHSRLKLTSQLIYARVQDLPLSLGPFDISVIASVLIHCRDPMGVLCRCCELTTQRVVVTESIMGRIVSKFPVMALLPSPDNAAIDSWWNIPAETIATMLQVMGFTNTQISYYQQLNWPTQKWVSHYTVVGEKPLEPSAPK